MNPLVKKLLIGVGVLLLLIVGIAIAVPLVFDPNDYRDEIAARVKQQTGRELQLGEIGLTVFPWLRATAKGVVLGNAEGFGPQPFAEVGEADVGVKLFPLLFDKRAEVSTVTLKGLRLNLAIDAQGRNNWSDLVKEKPEEEQKQPEDKKGFDPNQLDISGIEIEDASASFSDARSGKRYDVSRLKLETGAIRPDKPFDVELALNAQSAQPQAAADLELSGRVEQNREAQTLAVRGLQLKLKGGGPKLAGGKDAKADLELQGDVLHNLGKKLLTVDGLQLKLKGSGLGMETDSELKGRVIADLEKALYQLPGLTLSGTVAGAGIPGGKQPLKLSTDAQMDRKAGTLLLDKLQLQTAGLDLRSRIAGSGLGEGQTPSFSGPISIAPFNPRPLLEQLGVKLQTADPQVLTQASLSAQFRGGSRSAHFDQLQLKLDQSTVQGSLGIRDFKTKALELGLKVDQFDADRYLPPKKAQEAGKDKAAPPAGSKTAINDIKLPTEALQKLNANGTIDIAALKLNNLKLSDVRLKLSGAPGSAQTQELSAQLYGGRVATTSRVTPGTEPGVAFKAQLASLNAAPFLKDLIGKDRVSGLGNLTLDLSGRGDTVGELRRTLNGDFAFRVENGAVKGFNLAQVVRRAQATLGGNVAYQEAAEAPQTDFTVFSASARIINGVLKSDQLDGASPLFRVGGAGEIDLANETINYLAKPTIVNTLKGQGGKGLEQLAGLTIPIRLSGNLYHPKVSLDLKTALQQKATEQLRGQLKDKEDELRGKLQEKLGEKLGGSTATGEAPSGDALKQQLNDKLGDLLFGKKKKSAPAEPAPQPQTAPPPAEQPKTETPAAGASSP